ECLIAQPPIEVVVADGARGDHGPEVDGDAVELADRIEPGARRKLKHRLTPGAGAQRVIDHRGQGDRVDGRPLISWRQLERGHRTVWVRIWKRVDPQHLGGERAPHGEVATRLVPRLAIEVAMGGDAVDGEV